MSLTVKVQGGTPLSGKGLCHTCKGASIVRGQNGEERIVCQLGAFARGGDYNGLVTFRVAECGRFHPSNMPWLNEMEQMAWIIEARRRGQSGFKNPGELEVVVTKPNERKDLPPSQPTSS